MPFKFVHYYRVVPCFFHFTIDNLPRGIAVKCFRKFFAIEAQKNVRL